MPPSARSGHVDPHTCAARNVPPSPFGILLLAWKFSVDVLSAEFALYLEMYPDVKIYYRKFLLEPSGVSTARHSVRRVRRKPSSKPPFTRRLAFAARRLLNSPARVLAAPAGAAVETEVAVEHVVSISAAEVVVAPKAVQPVVSVRAIE